MMLAVNGIVLAVLAAVLFGAGTPAAKLLLAGIPPQVLAGLLYLGAGLGLAIVRQARRTRRSGLARRGDLPWLAAAILSGGVLGPVLLMEGLSRTPATGASLLLNLEGVWTTVLAALLFREHVGRHVAAGMALIVVGSAALSWQGTFAWGGAGGPALIAAACLCWGVDNNVTRRISGGDALMIGAAKGLVAGVVNLALGLTFSAGSLAWAHAPAALAVGFVSYGLSLWLFILALRALGAARTAAWFGLAPFIGAVASAAVFREPPTPALLAAGATMAGGAWLLLSERHGHRHAHEPLSHLHPHVHDAHHRHVHRPGESRGEPHVHRHAHPHRPDLHHRHAHG